MSDSDRQEGAEVLVLGEACSPAQMAIELLRLANEGMIEKLVIVACDAEGWQVAWDDTVDTPDLCEAATWLRLESERCVVEERNAGDCDGCEHCDPSDADPGTDPELPD